MIDLYDFLQISPTADSDTIHRVYQYFAARYHPDNQESGDAGMFRQVKMAYDVLSNRARRAEYDSRRKAETAKPLSSSVNFLDDQEGELNRRMAVLVILYHQRRRSPNQPSVTLKEIEERMGMPRDLLDFTLWYLQQKGYLSRTDNALYSLSVEGVDFIETERKSLPIVNRLLTSTTEVLSAAAAKARVEETLQELKNWTTADGNPASASGPIILPDSMDSITERRQNASDRRAGAPDKREFRFERRKKADRRAAA
jgi:curved DNA-binding protein CbpA